MLLNPCRLLPVSIMLVAGLPLFAQNKIVLDGTQEGRVFEGIGAVSAGASSRLLIDYPEPQRSQILDYLFKPGYGAALQHLKVEIGGGVNSTDGTEPTHMRTATDTNFNRGYEWWLMEQAQARNTNMIFDCLAWGAPGWIGSGNFWSQDMRNYLIKFIKGAKTYHNIDFSYTGIWNEKGYDTNWIVQYRTDLNNNGLSNVKLVAADEWAGLWNFINDLVANPALSNAVYAVGVHYPGASSPSVAQDSGKPLWASEDFSTTGDWPGAIGYARTLNRNYINGKITADEAWCPICSFYDVLPCAGTGLMKANQPWSGYYDVEPAIWAVAHTTQFASPGWTYLEGGASALLPSGGSIVTLVSTNHSDYSLVVETSDATVPQTIGFQLTNGLSTSTLHVWQTAQTNQFVQIAQVAPINGHFSYTFQPDAIYTLTTTTGQGKGDATPPASSPFPLPFKDDFESYSNNVTPKYFCDQAGTFETVTRADGQGKALRQVELQPGIEWGGDFSPYTLIGDATWTDYEVSSDVMLETNGFVFLYGRVGVVPGFWMTPHGYCLTVNNNPGDWELRNDTGVLATASITFATNVWHQLRLAMVGGRIRGYVDGNQVCDLQDYSYGAGMAGLGSGVHGAQFDNFSIRPLHSGPRNSGPRNLALGATANASSWWSSSYLPSAANDGDLGTRWNAGYGATTNQWLELDFPTVTTYNRVTISQFGTRILGYVIQHWDGSAWQDDYTGGQMQQIEVDNLNTVTASKMRLLITDFSIVPSIYEIGVYNDGPAVNIGTTATASASSSWSSSYTPNYANDGSFTTRWNSTNGTTAGEWLQLTFSAPVSFNQVVLSQLFNRITAYKIQYWSGSVWTDVVNATTNLGVNATLSFPTVISSKVRLFVVSATDTPSIYEFQVFNQPAAPPSISINEWMLNNSATLRDQADGQYSPWFELYNAGATNVDLSGYYLSGSVTNQFQFQIPNGYSIPSGGFLLVWADGQPALNNSTNANLHVNFTLASGATLGLFTPKGGQVDAVTIAACGADVAEGCPIDGDAAYFPLALPTPGKPNRVIQTDEFSVSAGGASLQFHGLPFQSHRIQATTNLVGGVWSNLVSETADAFGTLQFQDTQAGTLPRRFYRAVSP